MLLSSCFFFFNDPPTTEIYTLSLHDALPISLRHGRERHLGAPRAGGGGSDPRRAQAAGRQDRKSTRLNSSHMSISYAVFCLKKKKRRPSDSARVARLPYRLERSEPSPAICLA